MKRSCASSVLGLLLLAFVPATDIAQSQEPITRGAPGQKPKADSAPEGTMRLVAGEPFVEPPIIHSANGVLTTTMQLRLTRHKVAGRTIETGTYATVVPRNDGIPGPTFRVKPGDTLLFNLVNSLTMPGSGPPPPTRFVDCGRSPETLKMHAEGPPDPGVFLLTNIHTHGLQVSPVGNSDNPYINLKPGEGCRYEIKIPGPVSPADPFRPAQPAGLYWYHPHRHVATSKQSWGGLAGAIVVEGDIDRVPEVAAARERLLILQELWVDNNGHVPAGTVLPVGGPAGFEVPFSTNPAVPTNIYYTLNGVYQPTVSIQPGETQRWRILNASPHRFYRLYLEGHRYVQIAQDGIAFGEAVDVDQDSRPIILAPGNRVEIVIQGLTGEPTKRAYALKALPYDQGHPAGALPEAILATLEYSGPAVTGRKLPTKLVATAPDITTKELNGVPQTIVFNGTVLQEPVRFFINGQQFNPSMTPITGQVGRAAEWTLCNNDVFQHPFHIHVNPFQVVEINGKKIDKPTWWDTFALPPRLSSAAPNDPSSCVAGASSIVKVRMRFRSDITGKTVFHCHILPHEDNGMMSVFQLVP